MQVRQLLTRVDDDLHERLKQVAEQSGQSVNAWVTGLLRQAVDDASPPRERLRRRLEREGRLAQGSAEAREREVPSRQDALQASEGLRDEVLAALDHDRSR